MHSEITLPRGYQLQEYRIESTLGVGGFGLTYLATDANLNMQVAIKEYLPSDLALRAEDQSIRSKSDHTLERFTWGRARFLDESRTLASFRHPNIVRVMRFFEANQTAYMVMEFVAGQPLNEWVKTRRPVHAEALTEMALALLGGIAVIHQSGYLHRDIKPGNIFLRQDGTPVLLDFGSARASSADTERTAIVSPGYAPLEQYHAHGNQGPWSDIYALGAVLYWVITGNKPMEATARVPHDAMPLAVQLGDLTRYPRALLEAIDWSLAPAERSRPQTAAALCQTLESLLNRGATRNHSVYADHTQRPDTTVVMGHTSHPPPTSHQGHASQTTSAPGFDADALKRMAVDLAAHLGPVASIVVKSAAKKAVTLHQLVTSLATDIADGTARADFIRKHAPVSDRSGTPATDRSQPARSTTLATGLYPPQSPFDSAMLARAELELAQHIGAVAKAIVRRASARAHTEQELYALLANEIDDANDRKSFLRRVMSVSGRV
jgi:serine/threonine protein kinase